MYSSYDGGTSYWGGKSSIIWQGTVGVKTSDSEWALESIELASSISKSMTAPFVPLATIGDKFALEWAFGSWEWKLGVTLKLFRRTLLKCEFLVLARWLSSASIFFLRCRQQYSRITKNVNQMIFVTISWLRFDVWTENKLLWNTTHCSLTFTHRHLPLYAECPKCSFHFPLAVFHSRVHSNLRSYVLNLISIHLMTSKRYSTFTYY